MKLDGVGKYAFLTQVKKGCKKDSEFLLGDKKCGFGGLCLSVIYLFRFL